MSATVCEQCGKRVSKNNVNIHGICSLCVAHNNAASAIKTPEKKCTKCGEVKSVAEFSKNKSAPDGLQYHCKSCQSKAAAKLYIKKRAKAKIDSEKKQCSKCKEVQLRSGFYNDKTTKDGKACQCKKCMQEYSKTKRQQHLKDMAKITDVDHAKNLSELLSGIKTPTTDTKEAMMEASEITFTPTEIKPKTNWNIHIPYIAVIAVMALITVLTLTQTAQ